LIGAKGIFITTTRELFSWHACLFLKRLDRKHVVVSIYWNRQKW